MCKLPGKEKKGEKRGIIYAGRRDRSGNVLKHESHVESEELVKRKEKQSKAKNRKGIKSEEPTSTFRQLEIIFKHGFRM